MTACHNISGKANKTELDICEAAIAASELEKDFGNATVERMNFERHFTYQRVKELLLGNQRLRDAAELARDGWESLNESISADDIAECGNRVFVSIEKLEHFERDMNESIELLEQPHE